MLLSLTVLVLGVLAAACSELHADGGMVRELTEAIYRMEAKLGRMESKRTEDLQKVTEAMQEMEARIEAKLAENEAKRTGDLHDLDTVMDLIVAENQRLTRKTNQLEKHQVSTRMASDVSFSAYYEGAGQSPNYNEVIRFPQVFTNNGGHYNTTESIFTCPIYGTYYFVFSLNTGSLTDTDITNARIMVGYEELSVVWCYYTGPEHIDMQCGTSVVTRCNQGDTVAIYPVQPNTQIVGHNKRSTFSGFLIHADIPIN